MQKGTALGVLALFIGLGGLGLGVFDTISSIAPEPGIKNTWYYEGPVNSTDSGSHRDMGNFSLTVDIKAGESLYALFNARVKITGGTPGASYVHMRYWLYYSNGTYVGYYIGQKCYSLSWEPTSIQILIDNLNPAEYVIKLRWYLSSGATLAQAEDATLLVHSLVE
ncbi:MAG: hypothetical protein ACTSUE_13395 [Promethearchaeota archaeon]